MRPHFGCCLLVATFSALCPAAADEPVATLSKHLGSFAPYLGKTWRGKFADSTAEKPVYDVSRWERALGGQAVRILHSVGDGEYGGETIIMWDAKTEKLRFWYFTTAGFRTEGTMELADGKWTSHEVVTGNEQGVTEVTATSELLEGGRMRTKSRFLQNGKWVDGHEILYEEAPDAKVVFK